MTYTDYTKSVTDYLITQYEVSNDNLNEILPNAEGLIIWAFDNGNDARDTALEIINSVIL